MDVLPHHRRLARTAALGIALLVAACGEEPVPGAEAAPGLVSRDGREALRPAALPATGTVVYRVNAGGPALAASDGGPAWAADTAAAPSTYGNAGAAASQSYGTPDAIDTSDPSVPAGTPAALFQTERWDPPWGDEMAWHFPVDPGTYEVRLYFAEIYPGAYAPGARVFDVDAEGAPQRTGIDVYAAVGAEKGLVVSFQVASDATLDLRFRHAVENPAVKAVEIIYAGGGTTSEPQAAYRLDSGGPTLAASSGPAWANDTAASPSAWCNAAATGNATYANAHAIDRSDASVPAGTPEALFQTERYAAPGSSGLQCDFPVAPGDYLVRLYFAETYEPNFYPGARIFDVYLEGALAFSRVDVYAAVGGYKGYVREASVTADDLLSVRLAPVVENPALKGIEIIPFGGSPPPPSSGLPLNAFQVLATHNSYHLRPDVYDSPTWEYDMPTLTDQLSLYGVRGFEFDLHWDGQFAVYHWPVDPNSTCPHLQDCLGELKRWSDAHPGHMPLFVTIDLKYDPEGDNVFNHLNEIDGVIDSVWPRDRIYTPDDLTHGAGQVQDVVRANGWPSIEAARGKIIVKLMVEDAVAKRYANDGAGLQGKRMFIESGNTSLPWVVFAVFDDTVLAEQAVRGGYIVRARADNEPTMGEISQTRFDRTLATGAQLVTTDYPVPGTIEGYSTVIPGGEPARCNPITAPAGCVASDIE